MEQAFADRLLGAVEKKRSPCVVGLDTAIEMMPRAFLTSAGDATSRSEKAALLFAYNQMVIDVVGDLIPAVKPNSAFYEVYGADGIAALEKTAAYARSKGLIVILDAKRGDIGSTSEAYAKAYLDLSTPYDALTLNPYLGDDGLEPFLTACSKNGKGVFILVKTSNKGSALFQDRETEGRKLYELVAEFIHAAAQRTLGERGYSGIGAVVGATWPEHAAQIRRLLPQSILLVPGYGAQGGDSAAISACFNSDRLGAVVNSSRAILYPHLKKTTDEDYRSLIRLAAESFVSDIRKMIGL